MRLPYLSFGFSRNLDLNCRMDRIPEDRRSWNMSRIRSKDTAPELTVRSLLHRLGYRFRLHRKDLPGQPDIALPRHKAVILVHGCYWHRHEGCRYAYTPKSRSEFWQRKFDENIQRDKRTVRCLEEAGWRVLVVWECETVDENVLADRLERFLEVRSGQTEAALRKRENS